MITESSIMLVQETTFCFPRQPVHKLCPLPEISSMIFSLLPSFFLENKEYRISQIIPLFFVENIEACWCKLPQFPTSNPLTFACSSLWRKFTFSYWKPKPSWCFRSSSFLKYWGLISDLDPPLIPFFSCLYHPSLPLHQVTSFSK